MKSSEMREKYKQLIIINYKIYNKNVYSSTSELKTNTQVRPSHFGTFDARACKITDVNF